MFDNIRQLEEIDVDFSDSEYSLPDEYKRPAKGYEYLNTFDDESELKRHKIKVNYEITADLLSISQQDDPQNHISSIYEFEDDNEEIKEDIKMFGPIEESKHLQIDNAEETQQDSPQNKSGLQDFPENDDSIPEDMELDLDLGSDIDEIAIEDDGEEGDEEIDIVE